MRGKRMPADKINEIEDWMRIRMKGMKSERGKSGLKGNQNKKKKIIEAGTKQSEDVLRVNGKGKENKGSDGERTRIRTRKDGGIRETRNKKKKRRQQIKKMFY